MRTINWFFLALRYLIMGTVTLVALQAHAGVMSPCSTPMVLPGPRVHVFILPYHAEGKLSLQGRQLVTIMQRHVLFTALKYQSIAIEELTADSNDCNYERVSERVLPKLAPGQVAIFLWGRLFEQGNAIRLQSTVAFTIKNTPDTVAWNISGSETTKISATIPSDPVMFAPRTIPLGFLEMLESAQVQARRLHRMPDINSSYWELPASHEARFGFEVVETKNDWMHIRMIPGGGDGWVPAHALATASDLKGTFPELYFVDGLIGYHQLVNKGAISSETKRRRIVDGALTSFDQYIQLAAGRAESDARALAAVMKGNALLRGAGDEWNVDALKNAQRQYREAQAVAPTLTSASTFYLAITAALCDRGECAEGTDRLHANFLAAIARDPSDRELLKNLNVFYTAAERGKIKLDISQESIATQRAIVDRASR